MIRNSLDSNGEESIPAPYTDSEQEETRKMAKCFHLFTMPGPITQTFLTTSYLTSLLIYELGNKLLIPTIHSFAKIKTDYICKVLSTAPDTELVPNK